MTLVGLSLGFGGEFCHDNPDKVVMEYSNNLVRDVADRNEPKMRDRIPGLYVCSRICGPPVLHSQIKECSRVTGCCWWCGAGDRQDITAWDADLQTLTDRLNWMFNRPEPGLAEHAGLPTPRPF